MPDLEALCNTIHSDIRGYLAEMDEAGVDGIPSKTQLQGYQLMRELLEFAESLAASLRYDLQQDHTQCQIHDGMMVTKMMTVRTELSKMGW